VVEENEENNKLSEENTKLYEENAKLSEENTKLFKENTKLSEDNAKLSEDNAKLSEGKIIERIQDKERSQELKREVCMHYLALMSDVVLSSAFHAL
jgi:cell division protein FtsB